MDVAMEMVKELEITNWEPFEIAEMIDGEISALVPNWKKDSTSSHETHHIYNYQEDDDDGPHHPFHSHSSRSSSQASLSGLITSLGMIGGSDWIQGLALFFSFLFLIFLITYKL